jgi:hypothetical protein
MSLLERQRRARQGAAPITVGCDREAEDSKNAGRRKPPRLRLIVNPFLELETARYAYELAQLGCYYDRDQQLVERRIANAFARLANARAAVARARS